METKLVKKENRISLSLYEIDFSNKEHSENERFIVSDIVGLLIETSHTNEIIKLGVLDIENIEDFSLLTKEFIDRILSIIDRDGKYLGVLAIQYPNSFLNILDEYKNMSYDYKDDIYNEIRNGRLKLTEKQKEEWNQKLTQISERIESLGFHSINDYCNFENNEAYIYGDIGKELSDFSISKAEEFQRNKK